MWWHEIERRVTNLPKPHGHATEGGVRDGTDILHNCEVAKLPTRIEQQENAQKITRGLPSRMVSDFKTPFTRNELLHLDSIGSSAGARLLAGPGLHNL